MEIFGDETESFVQMESREYGKSCTGFYSVYCDIIKYLMYNSALAILYGNAVLGRSK